MITRLLAAAAALTALAAAPAPGTPRPGQWEASVHPRAIPIPDSIARDTGDLFRRLMTEPYTSKLCLKRKAADPASLFAFTGDANKSQKSCTATHVDLHDGQMTGEASCTESGNPFTATLAGNYDAQSLHYDVTRVKGGLDRPGTIAARVDAKRTGSCG